MLEQLGKINVDHLVVSMLITDLRYLTRFKGLWCDQEAKTEENIPMTHLIYTTPNFNQDETRTYLTKQFHELIFT